MIMHVYMYIYICIYIYRYIYYVYIYAREPAIWGPSYSETSHPGPQPPAVAVGPRLQLSEVVFGSRQLLLCRSQLGTCQLTRVPLKGSLKGSIRDL